MWKLDIPSVEKSLHCIIQTQIVLAQVARAHYSSLHCIMWKSKYMWRPWLAILGEWSMVSAALIKLAVHL